MSWIKEHNKKKYKYFIIMLLLCSCIPYTIVCKNYSLPAMDIHTPEEQISFGIIYIISMTFGYFIPALRTNANIGIYHTTDDQQLSFTAGKNGFSLRYEYGNVHNKKNTSFKTRLDPVYSSNASDLQTVFTRSFFAGASGQLLLTAHKLLAKEIKNNTQPDWYIDHEKLRFIKDKNERIIKEYLQQKRNKNV